MLICVVAVLPAPTMLITIMPQLLKCLPISTQNSTYNPRRITTACNYSKNGAMDTVKKKRALGAKTWGAKSQYCHLLPLLKKREEKESSLWHISPSTSPHPLHHLRCLITPVSSSSTLIQTPKLQILSSAAQNRSSSLMKLCRLLLLLAVLQLQLLVAVMLKR